ncbi:hypothetical protein BpHYR1_054528 [Brachionus plicatilis]|uniref:Uncharacterized protein n=1 Tax=Brachionus plicatilis TaxID=10195 RepID=A0A3M7R2U4_BRAPC|nr:hypothetical protein BpHYR1_054528 [Brachionus plicatilis]
MPIKNFSFLIFFLQFSELEIDFRPDLRKSQKTKSIHQVNRVDLKKFSRPSPLPTLREIRFELVNLLVFDFEQMLNLVRQKVQVDSGG